eukprot:Amastigsp_a677685_162.p3 type:complete len:101 gc:universal Amastigsp_a677685_162:276-578(+)
MPGSRNLVASMGLSTAQASAQAQRPTAPRARTRCLTLQRFSTSILRAHSTCSDSRRQSWPNRRRTTMGSVVLLSTSPRSRHSTASKAKSHTPHPRAASSA